MPIAKRKGEHLFHQGGDSTAIYWLESGLLKAYYTTSDGKELIKSILSDGEIIGSLSSAYKGAECSFSVVCLEDSKLLEIPFGAMYRAGQSDLTLAGDLMNILLRFAMKKEQREQELLCLSPEERYRKVLQERPNLINQITQNDLAKYLGLTGVGLSRIKKRVTD